MTGSDPVRPSRPATNPRPANTGATGSLPRRREHTRRTRTPPERRQPGAAREHFAPRPPQRPSALTDRSREGCASAADASDHARTGGAKATGAGACDGAARVHVSEENAMNDQPTKSQMKITVLAALWLSASSRRWSRLVSPRRRCEQRRAGGR